MHHISYTSICNKYIGWLVQIYHVTLDCLAWYIYICVCALNDFEEYICFNYRILGIIPKWPYFSLVNYHDLSRYVLYHITCVVSSPCHPSISPAGSRNNARSIASAFDLAKLEIRTAPQPGLRAEADPRISWVSFWWTAWWFSIIYIYIISIYV